MYAIALRVQILSRVTTMTKKLLKLSSGLSDHRKRARCNGDASFMRRGYITHISVAQREFSSRQSENQAAAAGPHIFCGPPTEFIHRAKSGLFSALQGFFHARGVTSHVIATKSEVRASFRKYREKFAEKFAEENLRSSSMRRTNLPALWILSTKRISRLELYGRDIYSSSVKVDK